MKNKGCLLKNDLLKENTQRNYALIETYVKKKIK